ncbi:hypothetical protein CEXT_148941 [Caerostris extrusa]|uniref:Uncharacterized protein n=1 Tax=Caerostris extrusa TaxID=172846 RepID=A0AAV4Y725_CAEEX|nr:hypothetical protein CEXT_148941 [Caerostris extrusa]
MKVAMRERATGSRDMSFPPSRYSSWVFFFSVKLEEDTEAAGQHQHGGEDHVVRGAQGELVGMHDCSVSMCSHCLLLPYNFTVDSCKAEKHMSFNAIKMYTMYSILQYN